MKHEGENYIFIQPFSTTGGLVAHNAAMNVGDEYTFEAKIGPVTWVQGATYEAIFHKPSQYSFLLTLTGALQLEMPSPALMVATSSVVVPFVALQPGWVRAHYVRNTGGGQYAVTFYTSYDGTNWTQLGTVRTGTSPAATPTGSSAIEIGGAVGTYRWSGRFYNMSIRNGNPASAKVINLNVDTATTLMPTTLADSVAGAVYTFGLGNYMISTGALLLLATEQNAYTLTTPFNIPGDFTSSVTGQRRSTWLASYGPTSGGGTQYGIHMENTGVYAANAAGYFGSAGGQFGGQVQNRIVMSRSGSTNVARANESTLTTFAFTGAAGNIVGTFAVRDNLWGDGIIHSAAVWQSAQTATLVEAWHNTVP